MKCEKDDQAAVEHEILKHGDEQNKQMSIAAALDKDVMKVSERMATKWGHIESRLMMQHSRGHELIRMMMSSLTQYDPAIDAGVALG